MKASHANMEEHVAHCTTKMTISVTAEEDELEKNVNKVNCTLIARDISRRDYFLEVNVFKNLKLYLIFLEIR